MTTYEAIQEVDAAEKEIISKHQILCQVADKTEKDIESAVSNSSTIKTFRPFLILSAIGLILMLTNNVFWGIVAVGIGIMRAYSVNQSTKQIETIITELRKEYTFTVNNHRSI